MKKTVFILTTIVFVFIGLGAYFGVSKTDFLKISQIEIVGARAETSARIRQKLLTHIGDSFWNVPMAQEINNIRLDPWVQSVEIRRELPQKLTVIVTERVPVALMANGQNGFTFVDAAGSVINAKAQPSELAKYPALFGFDEVSRQSLRTQAITLLKNLPPDGFISHKDVSEVDFDNEHGFQVTLAKTGIVVDLGKENLPVHVDRARQVVQYLDEHQIRATRVDSDYAKKVLVKVRKGR